MKSPRQHKAYWAFVGHRVSGIALAIFLPLHFHVLAMAIDEARMDSFLRLADMPAVKFAEWGLVLLLALHMFFGLRLLTLELFPWRSTRDARTAWIGWGLAASFCIGIVFIAGVI